MIRLNHSDDVVKREEGLAVHTTKEEITQQFALKYLNTFCKAVPLSTSCLIGLTPEQPLILEFEIGGKGSLKYFLAPKVGENE